MVAADFLELLRGLFGGLREGPDIGAATWEASPRSFSSSPSPSPSAKSKTSSGVAPGGAGGRKEPRLLKRLVRPLLARDDGPMHLSVN